MLSAVRKLLSFSVLFPSDRTRVILVFPLRFRLFLLRILARADFFFVRIAARRLPRFYRYDSVYSEFMRDYSLRAL